MRLVTGVICEWGTGEHRNQVVGTGGKKWKSLREVKTGLTGLLVLPLYFHLYK